MTQLTTTSDKSEADVTRDETKLVMEVVAGGGTVKESRESRKGCGLHQAMGKVLLVTAAAWLSACSSAPKQDPGYAGPIFPPHLAHLALHPFFAEGCDRSPGSALSLKNISVAFNANQRNYGFIQYSSGADRRAYQCAQLQQNLRYAIANEDARFRANNRCVGRTVEVNGRVQNQTRECFDVKEGYDALSHIESRPVRR